MLALLALWFDATAWPFVVGFVACAALVASSWIRRYRHRARLPKGLAGLWYRTERGRVEFHWRWSTPSEGRLRILRSEGPTIRAASDGDGGCPGVWRVFDGCRPCYAVDERLRPGASCRYAFFVCDADGGWNGPVRQRITALSADDVAHLEASQRGAATVDPSGGALGVRAPVAGLGGAAVVLTAAAIASVVDAVIDGVFDLLETLPPDKLEREGWVSVV
jgi:hypothetical protein